MSSKINVDVRDRSGLLDTITDSKTYEAAIWRDNDPGHAAHGLGRTPGEAITNAQVRFVTQEASRNISSNSSNSNKK
jgi:hypothetical protein